ncbi:MAG: DUF4340 domain-containing protein [Planctomycetes bacterium]|nr:DUF4340 domain-containing protein [Planctomycetota bacterium]
MSEVVKTGVILGAAAVLTVVAMSLGPTAVEQDLYSDEGQEFFPGFVDPAVAVDLEVTEFNADKATARKFAVHRDKDGRWTIPSHGGYPADAKDRMGKAASMLIGLQKSRAVSDRKEDHVAFGVVDPLDEGSETEGRGTRVTMKDSAGNVLADLIVGKELEGKMDVYYVRLPDKRRTYSTKLEGELSTKFSDWIETDLLKAQAFDIAKVKFDNYSIDEQAGRIVPGEKITVEKDKESKWTLADLDAEKEQPNADRLREIGDTLTQIKIVGVRTKPEGLTGKLEKASGFEAAILRQMLQDKGYFLSGGKLYSNEGDLIFETKKGIRYTLRFGELVPGDDDAVSSGAIGAAAPEPGPDGPQPVAKNNRYLMVTAEFDESLLDKPAGERMPADQLDKRKAARAEIEKIVAAIDRYRSAHDGALPESLQKLTEKPEGGGDAPLAELPKDPWEGDYSLEINGDDFVVSSYGADKAAGGEGVNHDVRNDAFVYEDDLGRADDQWKAYDTKLEDGRAEADKLTQRFGPWYYVIDKTLFDKLKPKRADLVEPKAADAPGENNK